MRLCEDSRDDRWAATLAIALVAVSATLLAAERPPEGSYRFVSGHSQEREVSLSLGGEVLRLTWPETAEWDTALLEVRAEAVGAASVEIRSGADTAEQHLPGGNGPRWLNLSFLRGHVSAGAALELRPHGVSVTEGKARLRLFDNRLDLGRPILIVAPHPDDAEIAAFGLYADRNAAIVTVTAGNAGPFHYQDVLPDAAEHYRFKGYLRVVDSVTVPWQGGIPLARCFNLGYFDARVGDMYERPHEPVAEMFSPNKDTLVYRRSNISHWLPIVQRLATWDHLVEDLASVLHRVKPAIIVMPDPSLDEHRDHEYVAVALASALRRWPHRVEVLLYTNHADDNRYPYGPAGTIVSLPPPPGSEILLDRVYSLPVSPALQTRKLFALESMHDLRLSPLEQTLCGTNRAGSAEAESPRNPDVDYFRRGVRANELFFVYDQDSLQSVIETFLAQEKSSP